MRPGDDNFELLPGLFDSENNPIAAGKPVTIVLHRDAMEITRARLVKAAPPGWQPQLRVDISAFDRTSSIDGQVIVRFVDGDGRMIVGPSSSSNAVGEMRNSTNFHIPPGTATYSLPDVTVPIPPGLLGRAAKADIRIFDRRMQSWSSSEVRLPLQ